MQESSLAIQCGPSLSSLSGARVIGKFMPLQQYNFLIGLRTAQAVDLDQITLQCCTFMVSIGCASGHFLKMPWAVEPRFL